MDEVTIDISQAVAAIARGADRFKVYERVAAEHPLQTVELREVLLFAPQCTRLDALKEALFGGGR